MAVVNELALANVPVPLDVHATPTLFVALDPPVIFIAPAFAQVAKFGPATEVGNLLIVSVFVDVASPQGELPVAVNVNVTLPAVISAALGV